MGLPQHPRVHLSPTARRRAAGVRPRSPATAPQPGSSSTPQPTYCGPLSRRSSPSVPGHSAPTRVVVPLCTHPLRAAKPQEFALGPRPQRPDQGRRSSPYPPTAGRRAAGVRPRSPARAPPPGSSFLSVPTHCGPPSCRSLPSVPGHSASTRVVFQPPTHLLQAAEPQEFALGPRPQRPDRGRLSPPNSPTPGRRAAGVRPRSPATAPRPGSSFDPQLTYCRPLSRRFSLSVPGHSAPTQTTCQTEGKHSPMGPQSQWQSSPHTMRRCYGCSTVCGRQGAGCMGTRHMSVCRQLPPWTGTRVCRLRLSLPPRCPRSRGS